MNLQVLRHNAYVTIYYDTWNNWLFVDWVGDLTLSAAQAGALEIAQCCLERVYTRVLNSNLAVEHVDWGVPKWLAETFLPLLTLAGVAQVAWVCAPSLRGRGMAETIAQRLLEPIIIICQDLDQAVSWLQDNRQLHTSAGRPATVQTQLERKTRAFMWDVSTQLRLSEVAVAVSS